MTPLLARLTHHFPFSNSKHNASARPLSDRSLLSPSSQQAPPRHTAPLPTPPVVHFNISGLHKLVHARCQPTTTQLNNALQLQSYLVCKFAS
eukprot:m.487257 g.487257  ORF g.487257 m.487257 type:complete len:92 (+) comp57222_c0_seq3:160-435(+)